MLDRGEQASIEEVHERIDDGTLFDWLASFKDVDLSLYEDEVKNDVLTCSPAVLTL